MYFFIFLYAYVSVKRQELPVGEKGALYKSTYYNYDDDDDDGNNDDGDY